MAIPGLLFFYFRLFNTQLTVYKCSILIIFWRWLDSKHGPQVLEATALPTEPQPLHQGKKTLGHESVGYKLRLDFNCHRLSETICTMQNQTKYFDQLFLFALIVPSHTVLKPALYAWWTVYLFWIRLLCLCWIINKFTCLVESKPVKQKVSHTVILYFPLWWVCSDLAFDLPLFEVYEHD